MAKAKTKPMSLAEVRAMLSYDPSFDYARDPDGYVVSRRTKYIMLSKAEVAQILRHLPRVPRK